MPYRSEPKYFAKYLAVLILVMAGAVSLPILLPNHSSRQESTARSSAPGADTKLPSTTESSESSPAGSVSNEMMRQRAGDAYGKLPLSFEANLGQTDERVRFISRGSGYGLFLTSTEAVLTLRNADEGLRDNENPIVSNQQSARRQSAALRMTLRGANPAPAIEGQDELPGKSNYFIGNDPAKWRRGVPNFQRVHYSSVYPGVDLVYYGNQRQLEYDFVVAPFADPSQIKLAFDGARRMRIGECGDLILSTAGGDVRQHKPVVYQNTEDGTRREIAGNYVRRGRYEVGFEVGEYDQTKPLVIDPVLVYSTYLGGSKNDNGNGIAVDAAGNAYVTGTTNSLDYPVTGGAFQTGPQFLSGSTTTYYGDAFVTKINATGTALVYSTYLGSGDGPDSGKGIAVDAAGNAYVTGQTTCLSCVNDRTLPGDFPTVNAFQSRFGGTDDAFITKLNPTGSELIFSTYMGGNISDSGARIVVNPTTGDSYTVGFAGSTNFPTTPGAYKSAPCPVTPCSQGGGYAFEAKFNAAGAIQWSTFIGQTAANDVALDSDGNTYVTGNGSCNFPTTPGAYQTTCSGAVVFVTKMNPQGSGLVYSTLFGQGTQSIRSWGIDIDAAGNAYITGQTQQPAMPTTPGAFDQSFNGGEDVFVAKFNATGSALLYSTYIGGSSSGDVGRSIAIDSSGNAFVTGQAGSTNFPYVNSLQDHVVGNPSIFLAKLNPAGSALIFASNLGTREGLDVVLDGAGNAYLTGRAAVIPFTPGVFQTRRNRNDDVIYDDAFVMKIGPADENAQTFSIEGTVSDENLTDPYSSSPLVTVTLTGTQNRAITIYPGNSYKFRNLPAGGTYTVTPTRPGFVVEPLSQTFTNLGANQTANFNVPRNIAPTVDITSPTSSETFTSPGPITVTATAADSDGTISRVEFEAVLDSNFDNPFFTGSDSTPPYSITINNVPAGSVSIYATAIDNMGRPGIYSDHVHLQVNCGTGPTIRLTSPANGASYRGGEYILVSADATASCGSSISHVDFFVGTELIARDEHAPYSTSWRSFVPGTFTLTAKAIGVSGSGTSQPSDPVTVTITETNPRIYGQVTDNAFGGAGGLSGVTMNLYGTRTATTTTDADGNYSFTNLNLPPDGNYIVVPSKDGYFFDPPSKSISYLGFEDYRVNFDATLDTPVTTDITSPGGINPTYISPATINIQANASSTAGAITKVDFYARRVNETPFLIGTDTNAPYSFDWNVVETNTFYLFVVATDVTGATGQSGSQPVEVIDGQPETIQIGGQVRSTNGSPFYNVTVTLSNGTQTFTTTTNFNGYYGFYNMPPGVNYTVTPPAAYTFTPPSYTFNNLTQNANDANFTSAQFNDPPTVMMTSPTPGSTYTMPVDIVVSADASDNDRVTNVTFYATGVDNTSNGVNIGTDTLPPYSIVWGVRAPGIYDVYAIVRDNGNLSTTSAPVRITVNPPPPVTISGRVVDRNSVGIPAVLMTLTGDQSATALTDANGFYSFTNLPTFNTYTVTPSSLFYTIIPSSRTFTDITTDVTADFTATLVLQPSDFDGDGITDVAVWRPSTGVWYINRTSDGVIVSQELGSQSHGDIATPGNFDGDLGTDFAIFRPAEGNWYILQSSTGKITVHHWGMQGDKPVAGDYDGDGHTDLAVFRPSNSTWYIRESSTQSMRVQPWGLSSDIAAPGDFDGDGQCDVAVFRPSNGTWYVLQSTDGSARTQPWGLSADVAVSGDYDGDDKTDIAVFRPGSQTWYILQSSTNSMKAQQWGVSTDKPVPGDYDLDGKTDIAVFRPSNGAWYVLKSSTNEMQVYWWGLSGDVPVPSAYLPQ